MRDFIILKKGNFSMENDDDISAMRSLKQLAKKAIEECNDMELLDLIYRMIKLNAEGRAD